MRKLHNPIGATANDTLIERRVAGSADHQEFDFHLLCKVDNISNRMARHDMGMQLDTTLIRQRPRPLNDRAITAGGRTGLFADLFNELGHVLHFFNTDHMKLGVVLFGHPNGQYQRVKGVLRSVIGMQDFTEHGSPPIIRRVAPRA
jgi:hypothetical protein